VAAPEDPWAEKPQEPDWVFAKDKPRTRPAGLGRPNRPQIPAVEVDKAGCSYNPDYEHHQDAIAEAVACEMQEQLSKELAPKVRH
jgi:nucleolar protein 53